MDVRQIRIHLPAFVPALILALTLITGCSPSSQPADAAKETYSDNTNYDVIVVGGEPAGVAAALSAARNGMRTLLVEEGGALGGLMTLGMLNYLDMSNGPDHELLTRGIFLDFYEDLANGSAFDVKDAELWFMEKCREESNLAVLLETVVTSPILDGNSIIGLEIFSRGDSVAKTVFGNAVIDATADGDVAEMAGVPYTIGASDYGSHSTMQAVTLVFEIRNVDWEKVVSYMKTSDNPNYGVVGMSAWGYSEEVVDFVPVEDNIRFRGPNMAMQKNGNLLLNALIIYEVDPLDPESYAEGIARGAREIPHIVDFMRERFIGFENAEYIGHAERLYVRESRHFIGEYRLTITDVMENRDFWDRIGHGSYPVDIHPAKLGEYGSVYGNPAIYSIPFRCLVPLKIDRLLIAGRSASYDSLAHGSARVVPVGMVTGEACGIAAAYSVKNSVTFRQMTHDPEAISWLQSEIKQQGGYLVEYEPPRFECMDHWSYPGLVVMRELGLAAGGYANDYRLDDSIADWNDKLTLRDNLQDFVNTVIGLLNERTENLGENRIPNCSISPGADEHTAGLLLLTAAECASAGYRDSIPADPGADGAATVPATFKNPAEAWDYLLGRGVLEEGDLQHFPDFDAIATNGQLMYVLGKLYTALVPTP